MSQLHSCHGIRCICPAEQSNCIIKLNACFPDLARQKVPWGDEEFAFEIDALKKKMLPEGLDQIGVTLARGDEITAFQQRHRIDRPWIYMQRTLPGD